MPADPGLVMIARSLAADRCAAEVSRELQAAGMRCVLLKGWTTASWLYPDAGRPYIDADLLIDPARRPQAEAVLARLGYEEGRNPPQDGPEHARPWLRPADGSNVDVHWTLHGPRAEPGRVWRVISGSTQTAVVAGVRLEVPTLPARALLVALHANQHGGRGHKSLEDLRRALVRADEGTWRAATGLARSMAAVSALAGGLALLPEGARLVDRLGLEALARAERPAGDSRSAPLVAGLERLATTPGVVRKLGMLAGEVLPPPGFLRWRHGFARRGRAGLALTYLWRPLWLTWHLIPSLRVWRRTRRG